MRHKFIGKKLLTTMSTDLTLGCWHRRWFLWIFVCIFQISYTWIYYFETLKEKIMTQKSDTNY